MLLISFNRCATSRPKLTPKLSLTLNLVQLNGKSSWFSKKCANFHGNIRLFCSWLISISYFIFLCVCLSIQKYEKMRQFLQAIRKNIEKMRFYMEKMSNAYQASVEKSKHHYFAHTYVSTYFHIESLNANSSTIHSSFIEKYGRASIKEHNGVPKRM